MIKYFLLISVFICYFFLKFQSFFGLGPSAEVEIVLDGQDSRKMAEIKTEDGRKEKQFLYLDGETVAGKVGVFLSIFGLFVSEIHVFEFLFYFVG